MDRALLRHNAAKAFTDHWFNNRRQRDMRALQDLPFHVVLDDDQIGDVARQLSSLHKDGANVVVASDIGDDGFKAAVIHMAPTRDSASRSKNEPIPVDPGITMGMLLVLLARHRKVLLAVKEYSCVSKATELIKT